MINKLKGITGGMLLILIVMLPACAGVITPTLTSPATTNPASTTPAGVPPLTNPSKGSIEFRVTDAPPDEQVTSIMVTVSKLEIHWGMDEPDSTATPSPTIPPEAGKWITLDIPKNAKTFDLIKLKGVEQMLSAGDFEVGKYTQIRLTVEKIEVALGESELKTATVPSGELKFVHPFEIKADEKTVIIMDFDAEKSVTVTGKDNIMVKPVIQLTVKQEAKGSSKPADDKAKQVPGYQIAEDFLKNSSTFAFDGMPETLNLVNTESEK